MNISLRFTDLFHERRIFELFSYLFFRILSTGRNFSPFRLVITFVMYFCSENLIFYIHVDININRFLIRFLFMSLLFIHLYSSCIYKLVGFSGECDKHMFTGFGRKLIASNRLSDHHRFRSEN